MLALATGEAVGTPTKADILPSLALGIGVHVGGWLAISTAIPKLPAARAARMSLLQPIFATVWGILFFSAPFGPLDAFGATLTLAGSYLATSGPRKAASSPEPTEMVTDP